MATRIPSNFRPVGPAGRPNRPQATRATTRVNDAGPDRDYLISQANKMLKTNPVKVAPLKRVNDWRKEYDRLKADAENPKEE